MRGKKTIAKTTGTRPRFITNNVLERDITRLGTANIREQIEVFKQSAKLNPDALILECMALRPDLQLKESEIVKPTTVVITNVRPDRLDVMGPTRNIKISISNTEEIPVNALENFSSVKIYDIIGRLVKSFDNLTGNIIWRCDDKFFRKVPNGVYCVVGETNERKLIKKIVVSGNSY